MKRNENGQNVENGVKKMKDRKRDKQRGDKMYYVIHTRVRCAQWPRANECNLQKCGNFFDSDVLFVVVVFFLVWSSFSLGVCGLALDDVMSLSIFTTTSYWFGFF